jgi:hypothetical protein
MRRWRCDWGFHLGVHYAVGASVSSATISSLQMAIGSRISNLTERSDCSSQSTLITTSCQTISSAKRITNMHQSVAMHRP